jgi:hypothetical protein
VQDVDAGTMRPARVWVWRGKFREIAGSLLVTDA